MGHTVIAAGRAPRMRMLLGRATGQITRSLIAAIAAIFVTPKARSPRRWPLGTLHAEVTQLANLVHRRWRRDGVRGFPLTIAATVTVSLLAVLDHVHASQGVLRACCGERADLSPWLAVARLPGSLFAPSPLLPAWGSILQVVVVTALAEAAVGRLKAGVVALAGHSLATLGAHVFLWLGPTAPLGLNDTWRRALDTGPSAATLALAAYLAVVVSTPILGSALTALTVIASLTMPGLAGTEHLVALTVGLSCGAIHLAALRWRVGTATLQGVDVEIPVSQA